MALKKPHPPVKSFRVLQAYGPYSKGAIIQPTGILRQALLQRKLIEEVLEDPEIIIPPPVEEKRSTLKLRGLK